MVAIISLMPKNTTLSSFKETTRDKSEGLFESVFPLPKTFLFILNPFFLSLYLTTILLFYYLMAISLFFSLKHTFSSHLTCHSLHPTYTPILLSIFSISNFSIFPLCAFCSSQTCDGVDDAREGLFLFILRVYQFFSILY
uniref:Putative ovule protein n=1 Tax=Solanum chacoense TaxID=4108 RepID=A0A0V0HYQ1_SOLCH